MKATEIIKTIMSIRGLNQGDLTTMLGLAYQSSVSGRLNRDMKMSSLAEFAKVLNCEVVMRDLTTGEEYQITE